MRIVIAGIGDVGYHLAKELSSESHDIIAIDKNQQRLSRIDSMVDILTITGSATSLGILKEAKTNEADLFVAVTSSEEVNITAAILAKKIGANKTIARIANAEYLSNDSDVNFKELGIDFMIYPEELAAQETVNLIKRTAATDILEFEGGMLSVMGLKLDKNSPVIGKTLTEIVHEYPNIDFRIVAIYRNFKTIIPSGKDRFLANDQVFVITKPEGIDMILKLAGKENLKFDNIMILGGSKIGRRAAELLQKEMTIKLIESNEDKTLSLAEDLSDTLIIHGDGRDIDLLAQEGIIDVDAFIAVTDDAETNIISCLMAKHLGVKKAIALVDKADYVPLTQTIGLDSLINKKLIAATNILQFIRRGEVIAQTTLEGIDAQLFEYIAQSNSPITKKAVKDIGFPKEAIIGGVIRGKESFIAVGNSQIKPNDKVVIFSLPGGVKKIEKFFK
ncbi:MAG: Trk system potassium transporter TrkA [Bacteroidetes bacterium]|nr:Trk system potassium transporter TrkA [Bacteroidota bacterium]MCH7769845.1 Trk system potassium transporter TrkA [Bacteroidota bacterium]